MTQVQWRREELPETEVVCWGQLDGTDVVADGQYWSTGQVSQKDAPVLDWKLPAPHGTGAGVVVELHLVPTGQIVQEADTGGLKNPRPQEVQAESPALERKPAEQLGQVRTDTPDDEATA